MQNPKDMESTKPYPNSVKECIKRQGYTLQEVADEIGISRRTLTSYVSGHVAIPRTYLEKIASTIGCDVEDLIARPSHHSDITSFPVLAGPQQSGLEQPPSKIVLASQIKTPLLFDQTIDEWLDNAESMVNLSWEAWFASRPKQAGRELSRLLPKLQHLLYTSVLSTHKLHIQELIIRCHGLLGVISLDALENNTALFHYTHAHQIATEIHDVNQATTYLALIGDVLRRQNEKQQAISRMEHARDQAINASRATQGHVLQLLAYTYADTGNEPAFEHTIQEATDLLAFTGEARDTVGKEFVPFEIYEIRGKASRDLGKPIDALKYLELAEKTLRAEAATPRWHALLDISKGQAYSDAGDLTNGVELASRGFLLAYKCHSPRQMNRVRKLLRKLEASPLKGEQKVRELKELVYETYMNMDLDK